MAPVAKVPFKRWIKPEVYPLFLAMGTALSICGFTMVRNLTVNPDVRISKEDREAGLLENYKEGEMYKNHGLRKYLAKQEPMIMPNINNHFSAPKWGRSWTMFKLASTILLLPETLNCQAAVRTSRIWCEGWGWTKPQSISNSNWSISSRPWIRVDHSESST